MGSDIGYRLSLGIPPCTCVLTHKQFQGARGTPAVTHPRTRPSTEPGVAPVSCRRSTKYAQGLHLCSSQNSPLERAAQPSSACHSGLCLSVTSSGRPLLSLSEAGSPFPCHLLSGSTLHLCPSDITGYTIICFSVPTGVKLVWDLKQVNVYKAVSPSCEMGTMIMPTSRRYCCDSGAGMKDLNM